MSELLLVENQGAVRILRMNRPEKLNALNTALTQALLDGLEAADADDSVRALVLAAEGRSFCAGADLSEFKDLTPDRQRLVVKRADLTCRTQAAPQKLTKPIVSAVRGAAVGGGAGLAIGCDMMVAGSDLKLGYPELKHSVVPALVMTGLQRQLGRKIAFELISLGRLLGAEEAQSAGPGEPGRRSGSGAGRRARDRPRLGGRAPDGDGRGEEPVLSRGRPSP